MHIHTITYAITLERKQLGQPYAVDTVRHQAPIPRVNDALNCSDYTASSDSIMSE
jgi:hypothetical protein